MRLGAASFSQLIVISPATSHSPNADGRTTSTLGVVTHPSPSPTDGQPGRRPHSTGREQPPGPSPSDAPSDVDSEAFEDPKGLKASKAAWRAWAQRQRRSAAFRSTAASHDAAITAEALRWLRELGATTVAAYVPSDEEPGGAGLVTALLDHCEALWVPKCAQRSTLRWGCITAWEDLAPAAYGLLEPTTHLEDSDILGSIDAVLVPGLAATPQGHRLGKGRGFYDRALEHTAAPRALLLYHHEVHQQVPYEAHDALVPTILTERGRVRNEAS